MVYIYLWRSITAHEMCVLCSPDCSNEFRYLSNYFYVVLFLYF